MKEYFSYDKNTKLNAVMLLQRRALQKQIDKFQNLLIHEENRSTTEVFSEVSFPNYLSLRFDINKKIIDDFEMTILGILDSDGKISTTARLQDFLLLMTRITKMDQRALCLYILNERLDSTCGQAFLELGGYRLLKRYLKMAEEEECIAELKLIINICKCIPFDVIIITETEIGRSINKLLKYRSKKENSNINTQLLEDIASLQKDVKALKELWKNSVSTEISEKSNKEHQNGNGGTSTATTSSSAAGSTTTKAKVTLSPETMDLLDGINERLFAQKRLIQQQQQLQFQHQHSQSHVSVTPLSEVSIDDSVIESKVTTPPTMLQPVTSSIMGSNMKSMFIDAQKNKFTQKPSSSLSSALLHSGQQQDTTAAMSIDPLTGVVTVSVSRDNDSSVRSSGSGDGSSSPGTHTTTINANTLARRTAGVELMVDKAKKLLAAQELSAQLEHSAHANFSNINGNYMKDSFNDIMNDTNGLDNNAKNIVNELAGISIMETADGEPIGLLSLREVNKPLHQYTNLKSALKKKITAADIVVDITASPLATTAVAPADTDVSTSTSATTTKRPIKWADVEGGSIKEVRTFEVKKLKTGSVATYKSHREMVRKERQLEKSTNISKINEAMQATVPWTRPAKRILSFEMQEYACGAVESPEAEAQSKRLAHVLEARYIDDSAIPSDPDELISSIYADEFAVGTTTAGMLVEEMPWIIAGSDGDSMLTGINSMNGMNGGDESDSMVELFQLVTRVTGYPVPVYNNISSCSASTSSSLVSAEFSQELINSLPECLRGLEIELVLALVQDENNILEILNDNGTVNEWKVAQMRQKLHLPPRHNDHYLLQQSQPMQSSSSVYGNQFNANIGYGIGSQQQQQSYQQQQQNLSGDGYNNYDNTQGALAQTQHVHGRGIGVGQQQQPRQRMSRFSPATSIAGGVSDDMNIQQQPWQQQQQDFGGSSSGGFQQQQQQDPYGRQSSGIGMMRRGGGGGSSGSYQPQQQDSSIDTSSEIIGSTGGGGVVNKLKRKFPTSKGNVPCKFFNTAKGCQFGDKCSFAHLAPENNISGNVSAGGSGSGGHMRGSSSGGNRQQQRSGSSSSGGSAYQQRNNNNNGNNNNLTSPKKSRYNPSDNINDSRNNNINNNSDGNDKSNSDMNTTADSSGTTSSTVDAFGRDIIQ